MIYHEILRSESSRMECSGGEIHARIASPRPIRGRGLLKERAAARAALAQLLAQLARRRLRTALQGPVGHNIKFLTVQYS